MGSLISPGVQVKEIDLTTIIPQVSTSVGAIAGVFRWGPVGERVLVDSETALVNRFGYPTNLNPETFFTAASFLSYTNALYVSRAANTSGSSPSVTANVTANSSTVVLTTGNTGSLVVGMDVIASGNNGVAIGSKIATIVNSTAFTLESGSQAVANTISDVIQFKSNTAFSAMALTGGSVANLSGQTVKNKDDFLLKSGTFDTDLAFVARYPGAMGNSLRVSVCGNSTGYNSTINLASFGANVNFTVNTNSNSTLVTIISNSTANASANAVALKALFAPTDLLQVGNTDIGTQFMQITSVSTTNTVGNTAVFQINFNDVYKLSSNAIYSSNSAASSTQNLARYWEFHNYVEGAPGQSAYQRNFGNSAINNDEVHVVIVDDKGQFTGVPGTVLETYRSLSLANDAVSLDGTNVFLQTVINDRSNYVYIVNDLPGLATATALNLGNTTVSRATYSFQYGADGADESNIELTALLGAYDQFKSKEEVDISLIMQGKARSSTLGNYLVDNIAQPRMDCVVFMSPQYADVVNNKGNEAQACVNFRNICRDTSYAVLDNNYKYMYDRYNDLYRYIPMNGDTAGLCARTDTTNDAWWSPAGFNRGQVKNIVKLAWNPRQADRDLLYKNGVNPYTTFPGQGTILYGDKTLQSKPSAFDRINVRRLFIVLEKAISKAAQYTLFEFNDNFTRAQFRNLIVPYLRDVQGRRGITDFLVVCDETNNTPYIIDSNQFVGDIYIKPARSINFITLNFVAVGTGVSFTEVVGKF